MNTCVNAENVNRKEKKRRKEEPSSLFQRQRVDMLLTELAAKFPPKSFPLTPQVQPAAASTGPTERIGNLLYVHYLYFAVCCLTPFVPL